MHVQAISGVEAGEWVAGATSRFEDLRSARANRVNAVNAAARTQGLALKRRKRGDAIIIGKSIQTVVVFSRSKEKAEGFCNARFPARELPGG